MTEKQIFILATRRAAELQPFIGTLEADEQVTLIQAAGAQETIDTAIRVVPALVIIDDGIDADGGLALARQLLQVNAFVHTVILSDMAEAMFHDAAEGLGVLMQLSATPESEDARQLLSHFRSLLP